MIHCLVGIPINVYLTCYNTLFSISILNELFNLTFCELLRTSNNLTPSQFYATRMSHSSDKPTPSESSHKLTPSNFGGYGRQSGEMCGLIDDENKPKEFVAFCPPDVQRNARIIAVCGTPDIRNHSSPAITQISTYFFTCFKTFVSN